VRISLVISIDLKTQLKEYCGSFINDAYKF